VILLDISLQGLRELSGSLRVRLQSGYNALVASQVSAETVTLGLCETLYAEGYDPQAKKLAAAGAAATSGGATVMAPDGSTFRVVRDLVGGAAQLLQFDRQTKAFTEVTRDPAEITQFLRGRVGIVSRQAFEAVFVLSPRQLPSRANEPEPAAAAAAPAAAKVDPDALKARLAELERQLADQEQIDNLEFELDGLQKQRFAVEDQLRALDVDTGELDGARAELRRLAYLEVLPEGFADRLTAYQSLVLKRAEELKKWQADRELVDREQPAGEMAPLSGDWRLWAGLLVGVAAIAVAKVIGGLAQWIALADIPAFGLAVFAIFESLSAREQRAQYLWKLRLSDQRRARLEARDKAEVGAVEALLKKVDSSDPDEVRRALATRAELNARVATLAAAAEAARANPERARLAAERDQLGSRIQAMEAHLASLSATPADVLALRAEAQHLRNQLHELEPPPPPPVTEAPPAKSPMSPAWLRAMGDLLLTDPITAARTVSERASLLVRALSENRLPAVSIAADGQVKIQSAAGGEVEWDKMPVAAQDLAYLALRAALYLAADQRARAPMICADLAASLAGGLTTVQTLLTTLAHGGQVVHVVRRAELAPGAKHVATAEVK
jgi:hypothetical protein